MCLLQNHQHEGTYRGQPTCATTNCQQATTYQQTTTGSEKNHAQRCFHNSQDNNCTDNNSNKANPRQVSTNSHSSNSVSTAATLHLKRQATSNIRPHGQLFVSRRLLHTPQPSCLHLRRSRTLCWAQPPTGDALLQGALRNRQQQANTSKTPLGCHRGWMR